jgi:hypothetical protein
MNGIELRLQVGHRCLAHLITQQALDEVVSVRDLVGEIASNLFDSLGGESQHESLFNPPDRIGDKTVKGMSEYVSNFLARRFPEGLPDQLRAILAEMVTDCFHDGARWSESTREDESRIIVD